MIKTNKFIHIFFLSAITLVMSACVPKATETKAVCGTNEAFSNITRSCYSIVELRTRPIGTKSSDTLSQEVAKTITLSYTDANKDQAISCKVNGPSANIEVVSPQVINRGIFNSADLVSAAANSLATNLPIGADRTNAIGVVIPAMQRALATAKETYNYSNVVLQLNVFGSAVDTILGYGASLVATNTTVKLFYNLIQSRLLVYGPLKTFVDNRCDCSGGICTTTIAPRVLQSGTAGFNYTISDIDGVGDPKSVSLSISATSPTTDYLRPAVESKYITGAESSTNVPSSYAFNLGTALDYYSTTTFTYSHNKTVSSVYFPTLLATKTYVPSDLSKGKITNCMGLGGSSATDTSCVYIPDNGDDYSLTVPAKALATIGDLTITAKVNGTAGNNISVVYKDITANISAFDGNHSTSTEKYGLVGANNDVYLRVIGDTIYVVFNEGITTTTDITTAILNDNLAKTLVDVSAGGALAVLADASDGVSLAGGVGGYDTFSYTVSNGLASSINTAQVAIQITSTLDFPMWNPYPSSSSALMAIDDTGTLRLEGSSDISTTINVSTTYHDPDNVATTCTISTNPVDLAIWSSGSNGLSGVTVADVSKANNDFGSPLLAPVPTCAITGVAPTKIITFTIPRNGDPKKTHTFGTYALLFKVSDGATLGTFSPTYQAFKFTITPVNDRPDATAISWVTSTSTPAWSDTNTTWTITSAKENSTASPSSTFADITVNPDVTATGFESGQTVTMTAVSDNQIILKDSSITVTPISATVQRVSFVTEKNQSSLTPVNITLTLNDHGGTTNGGVETYDKNIVLTVNMVDDPPFFVEEAGKVWEKTTVDTNEGGLVQTPGFVVDEDEGKSPDEDTQDIKITKIFSDNTAVLPASAVSIFYDLNDNGIEDSGESRAINAVLEDTTDPAYPNIDSALHKFYLKLQPVSGVSGNANVTLTVSDGINTTLSTFALVVHPITALHGGWSNISAVGIKTDKNGSPVSSSDIKCNYNKSTDIYKCDTTDTNCTGTNAPHGTITPSHVNVLFWDSANNKCYRSESSSKFSWVELTTSCPIARIFVSPTTLTTGINNSVATMTVASTAGFPANGFITIGTEQIKYTSKTLTTFTGLLRGQNFTSASVHLATEAVAYTANGDNFVKDPWAFPVQDVPVVTAKDQYYFDYATYSCYGSNETAPGVWAWNATTFIPSKVTLSWNAFIVSGSGADSTVGISGWNVYRREKGSDYDFKNGFLKVNPTDAMTINASARSFTDTTAVAGKVYYYLVRPIDNKRQLTISTPEIFSEVRIYAPKENYAFVHRWMANQEVCNSMHMTTSTTNKVDPTHNYRCPYTGPADDSGCNYTLTMVCGDGDGTDNDSACIGSATPQGTQNTNVGAIYYDSTADKCYKNTSAVSPGTDWTLQTTASHYYDIGKDMLVDISEVGCPYTPAPACTANGCIGIGSPATLSLSADENEVYYDRSSGVCYINTSAISPGTDWKSFTGATNAQMKTASSLSNMALNPPLTNISKAKAAIVCSWRDFAAAKGSLTGETWGTLPTKKEFIAYSAGPVGMSDPVLTDLEKGDSLNIQSRCNSSNASGLEASYSDSSIPSTSYIYSIPGTSSSGIRSLYTGSIPWGNNKSTESCSSRYGIQDVYGNVAEWVQESMKCDVLQTTTLSAGLSNASTSITVASTTGFTALTTITIDDEDMTLSSVNSTTTMTVVRGANSTTAVAHLNGSTVLLANANNYTCTTVAGTDLGNYNFGDGHKYAFDFVTGPYNDADADSAASVGDAFLANWDFKDKPFGAGKFSFPLGMPVLDAGSAGLSTPPPIFDLLDIGPSAGITSSQLHEDGIIVNGANINNAATNPTQTGSFAQGGSFLSGNRAGRYSSELVPDAFVGPDIGFRCYIPIDKDNYPADTGRHTYSY